jgi:ABC-type multidrug transport system fused ATPase/permease subunit
MSKLIRELVRPYWRTLCIVLAAMLVETAATIAGPWPLKIILDNVVGSHHLPQWLSDFVGPLLGGTSKMHIAAFAALFVVVIALANAVATYIDNYYTESVGQWVANDLRMRTYQHLQRLSLQVLREPSGRYDSEHYDLGHRNHPEFRLFRDIEHSG